MAEMETNGRVLLPSRNKKNIGEIGEEVRTSIELVWLEHVDDALAATFEPPAVAEFLKRFG